MTGHWSMLPKERLEFPDLARRFVWRKAAGWTTRPPEVPSSSFGFFFLPWLYVILFEIPLTSRLIDNLKKSQIKSNKSLLLFILLGLGDTGSLGDSVSISYSFLGSLPKILTTWIFLLVLYDETWDIFSRNVQEETVTVISDRKKHCQMLGFTLALPQVYSRSKERWRGE